MPTIAVDDDLEYFYTDSGCPARCRKLPYTYYHSWAFVPQWYIPAPIPHRPDEGDKALALQNLFVVSLTNALYLRRLLSPAKAEGVGSTEVKKGGITVGAWSFGNMYMISMMACIDVVDEEVRNRLQEYVTGFLLWDAPSQVLGAPEPPRSYLPLQDESLPLEDRRTGAVFAKWVSSHFNHGSDSTHNLNSLSYQWECDPFKKPTIETISRDELASMMEVTTGGDSESKIIDPTYVPVIQKLSTKALFDRDIRRLWENTGFYLLYGAQSPWNSTYAAWYLEDKIKEMESLNQIEGDFKIHICAQEGANHFPMWEIPYETLDAIIGCIGA